MTDLRDNEMDDSVEIPKRIMDVDPEALPETPMLVGHTDSTEMQISGKHSGQGDSATISISRPAYTQNSMINSMNLAWEEKPTVKEKLKSDLQKQCPCTAQCWKDRALKFFPFVDIMRNYQWKTWLLLDLISGISVGVIHIPQGMGFALLTNLPPVYGLYSSLFPVFLYFFFATSRHISMGTMALVSLMIGSVVTREVEKSGLVIPLPGENSTMTANETELIQHEIDAIRVGTAVSVSLLVGCFQFFMGLVGLGTVATFMSMPFISSFLTAAAVHIITSQVPGIFGLKLPPHPGTFKVPLTYYEVFYHITETNVATLITGVICLIVLYVLKEVINEKCRSRMKAPIPAELIVVIIATLISYYCNLTGLYNIKIVGPVPAGLPPPRVPPMNNASTYIGDAIIIAIISFAISISMAKLMAKKHGYAIDVNQELYAYGICHTVSSFFNCFAGAQAPPRSLVHDSIGGKTQVGSLFSCVMLLLVCLFLGKLFVPLPICVLAAIIIIALIPMFRQCKQLPALWRVSRGDFYVWVITFLSAVILDITNGLFIGMGLSVFLVVYQCHFPICSTLVHIEEPDMFLMKERLIADGISEFPGIPIFRFGAPLFFVNVEKFKALLYQKTGVARQKQLGDIHAEVLEESIMGIENENDPMDGTNCDSNNTKSNSVDVKTPSRPLLSRAQSRIRAVILDCSAISYVDIMGINMLQGIGGDLQKINIRLVLAGVPDFTSKKLEASGVISYNDDERTATMLTVYPTIQDAVAIETAASYQDHVSV